jgi:hypothetical protein
MEGAWTTKAISGVCVENERGYGVRYRPLQCEQQQETMSGLLRASDEPKKKVFPADAKVRQDERSLRFIVCGS